MSQLHELGIRSWAYILGGTQFNHNTQFNLQLWGIILQKAIYALNQYPIYNVISLIARPKNPEVEMEALPLNLITSKIFIPITYCSAGQDV